MTKDQQNVLLELDALIAGAWGQKQGASVRHDPALARNLEWIKEEFESLLEEVKKLNGRITDLNNIIDAYP